MRAVIPFSSACSRSHEVAAASVVCAFSRFVLASFRGQRLKWSCPPTPKGGTARRTWQRGQGLRGDDAPNQYRNARSQQQLQRGKTHVQTMHSLDTRFKSIAEPAFWVLNRSWMEMCGADFPLKLAPQGNRAASKRYNNLLCVLALFC